MRRRSNMLIYLWGLLSAVLFLGACSTTAQNAAEQRLENQTVKTVAATPAETAEKTVKESEAEMNVPTQPTENRSTVPAEQPSTGQASPGLTYQNMILNDGSVLEFAMLLPQDFNPTQSYPVLLALPPGEQSRAMVDAGLMGYWTSGAAGRDWIVISPIAPDGLLFFRGSERVLPEFLEEIGQQFLVEGGKYHLAGISNGGISAFRIAIQHPELFHSVVVLPGFPEGNDLKNLDRLRPIPVMMYVGEIDLEWVQKMMATQEELERLHVNSTLELVPLEGHVIAKVSGKEIFDLLEGYR